MAQHSLPWNGTGGDGGPYTDDLWDTADEFTFAPVSQTQGVITDWPTEGGSEWAASTPAANTLRIGPGALILKGKRCWSDANEDINIPTPAGATRIDRVVERGIWGVTKAARLTRLAGVEGSGVPIEPTYNDGNTWDQLMYKVSITVGGVMTVTREWRRRFFGYLPGQTFLIAGTLGGSDGHRPVIDGIAREYLHLANGEMVNGVQTLDSRNRVPMGAGDTYGVNAAAGLAELNLQHRHYEADIHITTADGPSNEAWVANGADHLVSEPTHRHWLLAHYGDYQLSATQSILNPYRGWYYITYVG